MHLRVSLGDFKDFIVFYDELVASSIFGIPGECPGVVLLN
jgi:hypothetical protein